MTVSLSELTRYGMLARGWGTRGGLGNTARARDIDPRAFDQLYFPEESARVEAVHYLGEFGGAEEVDILGEALLIPRGSLQVRRAATSALACIGGPKALRYLMDAFGSMEEPKILRIDALCAIMELVTGDWEMYQMSSGKVVMPEHIKSALKMFVDDPSVGEAVRDVLRTVY